MIQTCIVTGIVGGVSGMALCWLLTKIWDIKMKAIAVSRPHVDQQEEAPNEERQAKMKASKKRMRSICIVRGLLFACNAICLAAS